MLVNSLRGRRSKGKGKGITLVLSIFITFLKINQLCMYCLYSALAIVLHRVFSVGKQLFETRRTVIKFGWDSRSCGIYFIKFFFLAAAEFP